MYHQQTISEEGPTCPVCGMPINDMRHAFTTQHSGMLLAFDQQECLKAFLEEPEHYLEPKKP